MLHWILEDYSILTITNDYRDSRYEQTNTLEIYYWSGGAGATSRAENSQRDGVPAWAVLSSVRSFVRSFVRSSLTKSLLAKVK